MMGRLLLIFLLLTTGFYNLNGQSYAIYNYSIAEGLPSNETYEVFQDGNGFIWFATDNGVVKYNGKEMEVFNVKDGLSDPVVFGFYQDHQKRIWFRTYAGALSYYENGIIRKHANNKSLPNSPYTIYCDANNEIWIAGAGYMGKIEQEDIRLAPLKNRSVTYKSFDSGHLLASNSTSTTIQEIIIDGKSFPITVSDTISYNSSFRSVRWQGSLLLSIGRDIFQYNGKDVTKVYTSKKLIISLSKDQHENLWVGYFSGGAERFSNDFSKPWRLPHLENKSVTGMTHDSEGGFWFSTLEKGVYLMPSLTIETYPIELSSKINKLITSDNNIIIGDFTGSVYLFDAITRQVKTRSSVGSYLRAMHVDSRKKIWVSGARTMIYDKYLKQEKSVPFSNNSFQENNDRYLWGISDDRLQRFDTTGQAIDILPLTKNYRTLYADDSLFYLGGNIGLDLISKNGKMIGSIKELSNTRVNKIQSFNDSTLFISTLNAGFFLFNKQNNKIAYHSHHKLLANNIYSSLITDSMLWLGTENGLAFIELQSLTKKYPSFNYLNKKNGLSDNFINHIALIDKSIFAFSDYGYSIIPVSFRRIHIDPKFYLKQSFINGKPVKSLSSSILTHIENNLEIDFGYISFQNPHVLIRYRLNEHDPWVYTSATKLQFSSLAPGAYFLQLQFSIDNVHWKNALAAIPVIIESPWWARWYMYAGVMILLGVTILVYFKKQQSSERKKQRYLKVIAEHQQKLIQSEIVAFERERNRLAKELHDGVGTNLTAIKLMLGQLLKNNKGPIASDIEEQFRITIEEIKSIIYDLTPPSLERYGLFTALKNYIGQLNKNIPIKISIETFGEDVNNYKLNIIIFRILQELVSNSIKHSYAKNINIHLNSFDDLLNIVYEDDGIGFTYNNSQHGLGLNNVESRISSVNGVLKFESGSFGVSYNIDIPLTIKTNII